MLNNKAINVADALSDLCGVDVRQAVELGLDAQGHDGRADFYHNESHPRNMVSMLLECNFPKPLPVFVALAIAWHDETYVPGAKDNEEQSAANMVRAIQEDCDSSTFGISDVTLAAELILLTKKHQMPTSGLLSLACFSSWVKLFLALDLAIMTTCDPHELLAWETGIRNEHKNIPLHQYINARTSFLAGMLKRFASGGDAAKIIRALPRSAAVAERVRDNIRTLINVLDSNFSDEEVTNG